MTIKESFVDDLLSDLDGPEEEIFQSMVSEMDKSMWEYIPVLSDEYKETRVKENVDLSTLWASDPDVTSFFDGPAKESVPPPISPLSLEILGVSEDTTKESVLLEPVENSLPDEFGAKVIGKFIKREKVNLNSPLEGKTSDTKELPSRVRAAKGPKVSVLTGNNACEEKVSRVQFKHSSKNRLAVDVRGEPSEIGGTWKLPENITPVTGGNPLGVRKSMLKDLENTDFTDTTICHFSVPADPEAYTDPKTTSFNSGIGNKKWEVVWKYGEPTIPCWGEVKEAAKFEFTNFQFFTGHEEPTILYACEGHFGIPNGGSYYQEGVIPVVTEPSTPEMESLWVGSNPDDPERLPDGLDRNRYRMDPTTESMDGSGTTLDDFIIEGMDEDTSVHLSHRSHKKTADSGTETVLVSESTVQG